MPLMTAQGNGHVFVQATQPVSWADGDIWIDTSASPRLIKYNDNGTVRTSEMTLHKGVASGYASLSATSLVVQDPASKGLANGVAGLDASGNLIGVTPTISITFDGVATTLQELMAGL